MVPFWFLQITLLAVILLLAAPISNGAVVEVSGDGSAASSFDDTTKSVVMRNYYTDRPIHLFWEGDDGSTVKMGKLGQGGATDINTFVGHTFFATFDPEGTKRVVPREVVIVKSQDEYIFGPEDIDPAIAALPVAQSLNSLPTSPARPIHPSVKILNSRTTAVSAKFRSMVRDPIKIWYENGSGGSFQGALALGKEYTLNTYEGHVFFFTNDAKTIEFARFRMRKDQVLYIITDPAFPAPDALLEHTAKEMAFMAEYLNRTGIQWRHYYGPNGPRPPPSQFMWPAAHIGQVHSVTSNEGFWTCRGPKNICQTKTPLELELQVVSTAPKAYVIDHFLSDFEVNEIIGLAEPQMKGSTVGNKDGGGARVDSTRTSRNTWISRRASVIIESLFIRAEHLLRIPRLDSRNTEDIQVVHYKDGQKYDSHHDWGVSGFPESRYITLLLYLSDMEGPNAGGETAFPKGADGAGFKVSPRKGSAVLFYNLLEDGNGDDLALHAALPIHHGEKWLANFWVWDPVRK